MSTAAQFWIGFGLQALLVVGSVFVAYSKLVTNIHVLAEGHRRMEGQRQEDLKRDAEYRAESRNAHATLNEQVQGISRAVAKHDAVLDTIRASVQNADAVQQRSAAP